MLSIDAGNVQTGTNTLPLTLSLGGEYTLVENSTVTINVLDKKEKDEVKESEQKEEDGGKEESGTKQDGTDENIAEKNTTEE